MCADSPADRVPRVDPLPEEEWDDVLKAVVATTGPLNLFTTLARHPGLFHSWIGFGSLLLMRGTLPGRDRELAILRTAHHRSCGYEWEHHRGLGLAAGLTEAEIAAVRLGPDGHGWGRGDRMVLTAADELHEHGTIGDATWAELSARFGERELIELVMLIGHYHMVAFTLNALRVQPEEGTGPGEGR
ncbi:MULTISPECIES: carboxymuconolactone decarboxylase family protein [Actinomadura]|uniref:Alkylhydroperoxidase family enzyme, contains CxxC motif n=1 Tax=Actinomadura madurae TaxID=1993 RepID=A0A1I4X3D6_9ACTN|nr:carboxymuconolactone decarboxylase family protein [Actinomadura madurae]SFN20152.1 Alkylhydroperoxidase family enzyme, contains CxxC motif [Actinomadura madurae]SPT63275.1 Carboxymuconolactone decarboxylase family [Actinomadura madurae]